MQAKRALDPVDRFAAVVHIDEVLVAIAVHIDGEVGIAIEAAFDLGDLTDKMPFPLSGFRLFVPPSATEDIEIAVEVDIGRCRRRVGRIGIENDRLERRRVSRREQKQEEAPGRNRIRHRLTVAKLRIQGQAAKHPIF